ncbi:MAG: hypothetical protein ACRDRL_27020 [Sciscionella sp.]
MTRSQDQLEERIRRVLDDAARQLPVRPVAWHEPPASAGRQRLRPNLRGIGALAAVLVALAIGGAALIVLGHQHRNPTPSPGGGPLPPAPAVALKPHLSRTESRYITAAWRATAARDRVCREGATPELTNGSPSRALTSHFAILRRPPTTAARFQRLLHNRHAYGPATEGRVGQELYLNQIRLARTAFGARFYVIPAGNVSGARGVPARCAREQVAALNHQIAHLAAHRRSEIRAAQARYLDYLRYLTLHPGGICATFVPAGARQLDLADNLGCGTLTYFGRSGRARRRRRGLARRDRVLDGGARRGHESHVGVRGRHRRSHPPREHRGASG